jgi:hypothetical protein
MSAGELRHERALTCARLGRDKDETLPRLREPGFDNLHEPVAAEKPRILVDVPPDE